VNAGWARGNLGNTSRFRQQEARKPNDLLSSASSLVQRMMMQRNFLFALVVVTISLIHSCSAISCKDEQGKAVDWW